VFGTVYSFEPDPLNFVALTVNTADLPNVFRYQAALGIERGALRGLKNGDRKFPANCGAWYVEGEGSIPTLAIDDLGLAACDMILLDVEGGEYSALRSAHETIARCKPVVMIEDKGLGETFYSERPGAAVTLLIKEHGYRIAAHYKNDKVLVPA
jgi:FkbM family methyltransferase